MYLCFLCGIIFLCCVKLEHVFLHSCLTHSMKTPTFNPFVSLIFPHFFYFYPFLLFLLVILDSFCSFCILEPFTIHLARLAFFFTHNDMYIICVFCCALFVYNVMLLTVFLLCVDHKLPQ